MNQSCSISIIVLLSVAFVFSAFAQTNHTEQSSSTKLVEAAKARLQHRITYDGRYIGIPYPNGDVPSDIGVCTDVVIRAYRQLDIDLQQLVHEDMRDNFDAYPSKRIWGLTRTDTNIDHRRVPNLQAFFTRNGISLVPTKTPNNYQAGDIVSWMLPGNLPHIGIVSDEKDTSSNVPLIIHNIGSGPVMDNILFAYKITGHYRYHD